MSDLVGGGIQDLIGGAAQIVAGGIQGAAGQVQHAACAAKGGVGEVRDVIRAQPITAALIVFALGYLFGRLGSLISLGPFSSWPELTRQPASALPGRTSTASRG